MSKKSKAIGIFLLFLFIVGGFLYLTVPITVRKRKISIVCLGATIICENFSVFGIRDKIFVKIVVSILGGTLNVTIVDEYNNTLFSKKAESLREIRTFLLRDVVSKTGDKYSILIIVGGILVSCNITIEITAYNNIFSSLVEK